MMEGTVTRFDGEFIYVDWPLGEVQEMDFDIDSINVGHVHWQIWRAPLQDHDEDDEDDRDDEDDEDDSTRVPSDAEEPASDDANMEVNP